MASHAAETTSTKPSSACPTHSPEAVAPPLFQNGVLTFQAHHVGWIVASFFSIIATAVSIWLIYKHLMWYTNKKQQRQIVRLLLMVPIYSIISTLAYFFWNHSVPLSLIRDAYEGVILASFFYLLLQYLAPTQAEQKEYFRTYVLKKWAWPFGWVKRKPDGLYFLQLMKWAILQYCWVRPLSDLAAIVLNMMGLYCEASWSPRFGSVWVLVIVSISVTIAMYCLIQFYLSISDRIKQYRPILQLFSIKAIIFLMFWQSAFLSALHAMNVIKDTKYMTAEEINVGFAALLQTFEMVLFAFLHVKCFSYIPYRKADRSQMTKKGPALANALDLRDLWRETRDGSVYMWKTARGKEAEIEARRRTHFERAMGKSRTLTDAKKELPPKPHGEDGADLDYESEDGVSIPQARRSRSADYGRRHNLDLEKNEKPHNLISNEKRTDVEGLHEGRQSSWWARFRRGLSNHDSAEETSITATPIRLPLHSSKNHVRAYALAPTNLDELPPPSLLKHVQGKSKGKAALVLDDDELDGPLAEKQPFMIWDPSLTEPPHIPLLDDAPPDTPPVQSLTHSASRNRNMHQKEDSLLGRIFARSPDTDLSDKEQHGSEAHQAVKLPSIFKRKQDIASAVKGWNYSPPKRAVPLSTPPKVSFLATPEDIPSIPSLSPSPPRAVAPNPPKADKHSPSVLPPPAQPIPVPHKSLSQARRPIVLVADEAGLIPSVEPTTSTLSYRQTATMQTVESPTKGRYRPTHGIVALPQDHEIRGGDSIRDHSRWKDSLPVQGPRRPKQIVLPSPLSPARYPGAQVISREPMSVPIPAYPSTFTSHGNSSHRLPPGAGQPMSSPQFTDPPDLSHLRGYPPPSARPRQMAETHKTPSLANSPPGVQFSPASLLGQSHQRTQRKEDAQSNRRRGRASKSQAQPLGSPDGQLSRRPRSHSSFGILSPVSDTGSLPLHPALRQHAASRRRQSQPLPPVPGAEPMLADPRELGMRHETLPVSPDAVNSPTSPTSPISDAPSLHADSRYPRVTSRSTYFDEYDTVNPYLTNIMNDLVAPEPVSQPAPSQHSVRRLKRR